MATTIHPVPPGTYPAQTFGDIVQPPGGTTAATVEVDCPVQTPFRMHATAYDGPSATGPWTMRGEAAAQGRAAGSTFRIDVRGQWVRVDVVLETTVQLGDVALTWLP